MTDAIVPGRFQPLHVGHAYIIGCAAARYDTVRIGVTSDEERTLRDPLTYEERHDLLDGLYDHAIYAIERPMDPDYVGGQLEEMSEEVVVVTANPETIAFVGDLGYPVDVVPELGRLAFSGERIRERALRGRRWRHLVPAEVAEVLADLGFEACLEDIVEQG